ncbi:MAG: 1-acyl-sn-glycerol-3-phosphate acyltransferase [Myxococcaceae bacterium]|nr:1-acyl-sn-glycerol-3-phosphate acyltransferase [Myxococcaceae bacterium]
MVIDAVAGRARQAARASGFVGLTAAMLPPFVARMATVSDADRSAVRDAWVGRWARSLLSLFAIEVVVEGTIPPPTQGRGRGRLVVTNHRSAIDIGVVLALFGGTMVSRADLATWPVVGAAARAVGTVFVDRSSAKSGAATIRAIQKHLEEGQTINLFPEGTTFDGDEVRPFHGGAFVSAVRAEAEVLPVGIAYPRASGAAFVNESFGSHLSRMAKSRPTRMVVSVGDPFVARKSDRATVITQRAQSEVQALVLRARDRCGP